MSVSVSVSVSVPRPVVTGGAGVVLVVSPLVSDTFPPLHLLDPLGQVGVVGVDVVVGLCPVVSSDKYKIITILSLNPSQCWPTLVYIFFRKRVGDKNIFWEKGKGKERDFTPNIAILGAISASPLLG